MTSLNTVASWVVVRRSDGAAILETYSAAVADAVNREKYDVLPIQTYLGNLNRKIRAA